MTFDRSCPAAALAAAIALASVPAVAAPLDSGIRFVDVENRSYASYALESLENLMLHGTDRYGTTHSPLLASNLDVRTKTNPPAGELTAADEVWRVDRRQRRAPGGSNVLLNQSVYGALVKATEATGDARYADFVDDNLRWAMDNLVDDNGLLWWGYHRHYNFHADSWDSEPGAPFHEMHFVDVPLWERMWNLNPSAVQTMIEAMWDRHVVNKATGQINRHDQPGGLSFITSSASYIDAFAFLSSKLPEREARGWERRALLLASYNWERRNEETNLLPHTPNEATRWDGLRSATTTPGVYVPALLRAYEFTGNSEFLDQVEAYLIGWGQSAYDPASGSFWGSLELDGTPVPGPWAVAGYERYEPRGLIDMWAPETITAQYNTDAARTYAIAAQRFGSEDLLLTAQRWASVIRSNLPAEQTLLNTWYGGYSSQWAPYGTYAEHYGQAIQFFDLMFEESGDLSYLQSARDLANQAISSLWYDGLFRGHPNKPYYEAVDGVGILIEALIDLDRRADQIALLPDFGDFNEDGIVDAADFEILTDHWLQSVEPYQRGDVTGDGFVSLRDFFRFKNELYSGPIESLAGIGVPEPPAIRLVAVTLFMGLHFARRIAP